MTTMATPATELAHQTTGNQGPSFRCPPGDTPTGTPADKVRELYAGAWFWLACCFPDAEARLASLPKAGKVARLEASAARRAARVVKGELALPAFALRLREWEEAAAETLATTEGPR